MFRRRWVCITTLIALVLVVVSAGIILLGVPPDEISRANFNRIQPGMSVAEVEGILGRKPDGINKFHGDLVVQQHEWMGPRSAIYVIFDNSGPVVDKIYVEFPLEN